MVEDYSHASSQDTVVLDLAGEYDIARQAELDAELAKAYSASAVVLDMREVTYIDSTALTCFIRLQKRLKENGPGRVQLSGVRPNVRRIFELTNLDQIFEVRSE